MVGGISTTWHPCLLAEISPHDGPGPSGTTHDVKRYNDLAHKNIAIDDAIFSEGFSTFGVVAGTIAQIGVRSLVIDRSNLTPNTRVFIYIDNADIMKAWIDLIAKGVVSEARELPWRTKQPDSISDIERCTCTSIEPSCCVITLLEPAKLAVDCCNGRCMIIDAPRKTRIWTNCNSVIAKKPKVTVGRAQGKDVIFFDGDWGDSLELPMLLIGDQFSAIAVGIERTNESAYGILRMTQRLSDGEFSAGFEIKG